MLPQLPGTFQRGALLREGGEGIVYEVGGHPDLLLKVYKAELTDQKRARLVRLIAAASPALLQHMAWPLRLLKDSSEDMIVMRYARGATEVHQLYETIDRRTLFPGADWRTLVMVARDTASAVAEVHQAGFIVADISDTNVLISPVLEVKLIDCDSFVPRDDSLTGIGTAFWWPPELTGRTERQPRTPDHDNFSLARLIFLLLFQGSDPLTAPPGQDGDLANERQFAFSHRVPMRKPNPNELTLADLPAEVASMFEYAFTSRQQASGPRPTAQAWAEALSRMCMQLVRCPKAESHWHVLGQSCPWCVMASLNPTYDPFRSDSVPAPRFPPQPAPSPRAPGRLKKAGGFVFTTLCVLGMVWFFSMHDSTPSRPVIAIPSVTKPQPVNDLPDEARALPQQVLLSIPRVASAPMEPPESRSLSTEERAALEARISDLVSQAFIASAPNHDLQLGHGSVRVECQRADLCFGVVTSPGQGTRTRRYAIGPEHGALKILAEAGDHDSP